jgi:putative transposase
MSQRIKGWRFIRVRSVLNIKRDSLGDFYLSFTCLVDDDAPTSNVTTGKSAGFDFGLKTFLTGSDGKEWKAPQPLKAALKELKVANRALSSKMDGSRNRKRAKDHLARVHRRIANVRNDYQWKLAKELVDTYDELYFETLAFQGMKALWGRKISDLAPANFLAKVDYLAEKTGKLYMRIDRWEPSSKRCSVCLEINENLELRDREWTCSCGVHHHRDINAAKNILRVGTSTHKGVGNKTALISASNDDLRIPRL